MMIQLVTVIAVAFGSVLFTASFSRIDAASYKLLNETYICGQYCDNEGITHDAEDCWHLEDMGLKFFCCSKYDYRYCCTNPPVTDVCLSCHNPCQSSTSDWWYYQWRLITGVVIAMLLSMLVVVGCYCWRYYDCECPCLSKCRRHTRQPGRRQQTVASTNRTTPSHQAEEISMDVALHSTDFDPSSIFAFEPPAYETLPKDPPRYAEVCFSGTDNAYDNLSFAPGSEESRTVSNSTEQTAVTLCQSPDPPPYTPSCASEPVLENEL